MLPFRVIPLQSSERSLKLSSMTIQCLPRYLQTALKPQKVTKEQVRRYSLILKYLDIYYKAEIDAIDTINDFKQQYSFMLIEYITWVDPRLAFDKIDRT
jgi:hypothetical protein